MAEFKKGDKVTVTQSDGTKRLGVVSRDQLPMHPYVMWRDDRTGGERTHRVEKVEAR